uniref:Uncharacterized protein n=1 Tax=Rhizophora mucronata TaxID=61149 RepID=A0A2P2QT40_RHIMU
MHIAFHCTIWTLPSRQHRAVLNNLHYDMILR